MTMTDEEVGRAVIELDNWQWLPGMLTLAFHEDDDRTKPRCHPPWRVMDPGVAGPWSDDPTWGALPDLSDFATFGCLAKLGYDAGWLKLVKAVVREGRPTKYYTKYFDKEGWLTETDLQTSPGRAVAMAAIARGSWL